GEPRRTSHRAAHKIRADHQPQNGEGVWVRYRANAARPYRRGDRIERERCWHQKIRPAEPKIMFRGGIMKFPRRKFLYLAAGAAALPALPRLAKAQAYPSRPIRLIIGYTP